ncbi:MAG: helix-turn-helix domain-containing protein [Phycisphaera sp.]|nr:helix-turn-helix domain-containing protein [Phycisphaera sp.]
MPMTRSNSNSTAGELLRKQRVEVLNKGLRQMAQILGIAAPHLTDIEKDRRTPSEELLLRIVQHYKMDEAELRAGWKRPEAIVDEVASQDATTARKVPQFLRTARDLTPEQWDKLIKEAGRMGGKKKG